ncbi:MAG: hypothetical protein DVB29_05125 [Verrucomicrobia bacterium]|nr:MAG: hypothetical protein DVB29_05125 [Verrucomicrobiota bacterium]
MNNIGSKISSAASAINPFKGTVNTEETSNEKLTFHGTEFKLDLGSKGNFALRKIYNSIVNAPGHAFNAVGLKSFTNYLYPKTPSPLTKENLKPHNQNNSTDSLSSPVADDDSSASQDSVESRDDSQSFDPHNKEDLNNNNQSNSEGTWRDVSG